MKRAMKYIQIQLLLKLVLVKNNYIHKLVVKCWTKKVRGKICRNGSILQKMKN